MTNYATLITGGAEPSPGENLIRWHLKRLGYEVANQAVPSDDAPSVNEYFEGNSVVIITSSLELKKAKRIIDELRLPVVALSGIPVEAMGFPKSVATDSDEDEADEQHVEWVRSGRENGTSPCRGVLSEARVRWVDPGTSTSALPLARYEKEQSKVVVFGYKSGARMQSNELAPNRRVGLFFNETTSRRLTLDGWRFFEMAVGWAVEPKEFDEIFKQEWDDIKARRRACYGKKYLTTANKTPDKSACENKPPDNLVGLAFSGGGIRSATFSLGFIQELNKLNLLRVFDYISTVSGGGYIGGWWSAWLSRNGYNAANRHDSIQLTAADIKDPVKFYREIADDPRSLHSHFKSQIVGIKSFIEGEKEIKDDILEKPTPKFTAKLKKHFADYFNSVIDGPPLYSDKYFVGEGMANIALTQQTSGLVKKEPLEQQDVKWLNRRLLEEAFPKYITPLDRGIFPKDEEVEPKRTDRYLPTGMNKSLAEGSLCAGRDPIHHLRLFSNYLTPRKGGLSGDTWRAVAVISRNLFLTWISLLPLLFALVLIGQFYFVMQMNSTKEFFYNYYGELERIKMVREAANSKLEQDRAEINSKYFDAVPRSDDVLPRPDRDQQIQIRNNKLEDKAVEHALTVYNLDREEDKAKENHNEYLNRRIYFAAGLPLLLFGWIAIIVMVWIGSTITLKPVLDWIAHMLGTICVGALMLCSYFVYMYSGQEGQSGSVKTDPLSVLKSSMAFLKLHPWWSLVAAFWVLISIFLWAFTYPKLVGKRKIKQTREWKKDLRRNKIDRANATLLVIFVIASLLLALSGFGHELTYYIWRDPSPRNQLMDYVAKAGGWAVVLLAIGGSIFTAVKGSPTGGQDKNPAESLSKTSKFIFAITPPLVMIVLIVLLSSLAHSLLARMNEKILKVESFMNIELFIMISAGIGFALTCFFAIYEMRGWRDRQWKHALAWFLALALISIVLGFGVVWLISYKRPVTEPASRLNTFWPLFIAYITGGIVAFRFLAFRKTWFEKFRRSTWFKRYGVLTTVTAGTVIIGSLIILTDKLITNIGEPTIYLWSTGAFVTGLCFVAIALLLEMAFGDNRTQRSVWLLSSAYVLLVALLFLNFFAHDTPGTGNTSHISALLGYLTLGLLAMALAWVIAFGWMADPNLLSMHLFYKSRLVRAYLGASNPERDTEEITQAAEEDDILLWTLKNCEKGAPYHLINTTLNLVGGRDLATAQRASASFLLSKNFCGSSRTGFRRTKRYMDGRLSLGTAVAVSGAALSPNMGAKTQTSSLAMLMTLMNIRLGYWAPTPNKGNWQSSHARLWPFYMFYEFLSQTNDLSSFCYLTDGGHFDNTGLYSLVERGCRFIVVVDNGADPKPCFEDLGDAIRRCRIDFKAEIDLKITGFFKSEDATSKDELAKSHYVVGNITYSPDHLREISWTQSDVENEAKRKGVIVLIKPSLTVNDLPDLRQYHRQNSDFPQQSTSDQSFDEAQFESYRKLGMQCAQEIFKDVAESNGFVGAIPLSKSLVNGFFKQLRKQSEKKAATGQTVNA